MRAQHHELGTWRAGATPACVPALRDGPQIRLEFPGACYHVINRGNYRHWMFGHERTKAAFEACLFEAEGQAERVGLRKVKSSCRRGASPAVIP